MFSILDANLEVFLVKICAANENISFFSVGGEGGAYLLDICLGFEPRVAKSRRLNWHFVSWFSNLRPAATLVNYVFIHSFIHSFVHPAVCLMTGPQPLPKRVLHLVRPRVSFLNFYYPVISLRSSSGCLRLLRLLPITLLIIFSQ